MDLYNKYLLACVVIALMGFCFVWYISTLPALFWMSCNEGTHRIQFSIAREDTSIIITYYGGTDSQFIDHLRIDVVDVMGPRQEYHWKPRIGKTIIVPLVQYPANVTVMGFAIDTRTYCQLSHAYNI